MKSHLRLGGLAAIFVSLAACTSDNPGAALQSAVPTAAASWDTARYTDYCPQLLLRDGTAILRREVGDQLAYVASVTETSRDCRVSGDRLLIHVGVAGRLVPGPAATPGTANLPLRVAVVQGEDVLYSRLGSREVMVDPAGGAVQFVYVDNEVSIPMPAERNVAIFAGFDDGDADE